MTQQQSNKQKQTLKKYLVFAVMGVAFLICMWLIFAPSAADKQAHENEAGFNSEIPDPRGAGIVGDKKTAYEQEQARLKQEERMNSLQDYAYMLGEQNETPEEKAAREERQLRMAPVPPDYQDDLNNGYIVRSGGTTYSTGRGRTSTYGTSGSAYNDISSTLNNFYEEPETDAEKEELKAELESLKSAMNEQKSQQITLDDQLALLERSYEMAARYTNNGTQASVSQETEQGTGRKTKVEPISHVREEVVTALSAPMTDLEFVQLFSRPRNTGFNTIGAKEDAGERNTVSAVVHGDQTLVSGESVRLRTTEPMRAGRHVIPRNTIVTGLCKIGGERLTVSVTSIEYGGMIIPVELEGYDSDGQQGIYIPGSMELDAFKEIAGNLGSGLGTTINLNQQSAGEQLLTDLGRGVIQGTSQYIGKKAREVKATLKGGYRVFLLPGETY